MTAAPVETSQQVSEIPAKKGKEPFFTRRMIIAVGAVSILLSAFVFWSNEEQDKKGLREERNSARIEAEANEEKAIVALWAAKQGIRQIVDIDTQNSNPPTVELSVDPSNPEACTVWFRFIGESLTLSQMDTTGRIYDSIEISNGERAQAVLNDICPPVKP